MKTVKFYVNGLEVANSRELIDVSILTRADIIPYYRYIIMRNVNDAEVQRVNKLILSKWTPSGLLWIKDKAWKNIPVTRT